MAKLPWILFLLALACNPVQEKSLSNQQTDWERGAVWYQIFPERFYNGSEANDPTVQDVPETDNPNWKISPWTADWYKLQPWELETGKPFYDGELVFARRYGGDLLGVIKKLDYLQELGIDAIYFNPIFEAPSLHKYNGSSYHHVDDNFGPDPEKDRQRLAEAAETEDPKTWIWTSADSTFLQLIREAHSRGIKVLIDGVFNHTGTEFFAFKDILQNGKKSRYRGWYEITSWDDPTTPSDEFTYKCWWGIKSLPELAEDENGIVSGPREYIFAATRRWMDPDGDGDPSDGVDGWRLDVAEEVAVPFWKEWHALVKSINPNAITVAEIWGDASEWLKDKRMDNVMNYPFAYATVDFFVDRQTKISSSEMVRRLQTIIANYGLETSKKLWNLLDSHDTDRLASMILNPDRDYDRQNGLRDNPDYNIQKPGEQERRIQKQIVAFQMCYIGAPVIYYGDEVGMWGADDPDDRKPMVWPEMTFEKEASHPLPGKIRRPDEVIFDGDLFSFYQKMIRFRHETPAVREGDVQFISADSPDVLIFSRETSGQQVIAIFNRHERDQVIALPKHHLSFRRFQDYLNKQTIEVSQAAIELNVSGRWFLILVSSN